jgi:hypothetical protein
MVLGEIKLWLPSRSLHYDSIRPSDSIALLHEVCTRNLSDFLIELHSITELVL